ncbi:MAG TPA: hypothetical protein VF746_29730 [Longimicrobium sp.]
MRHTLGKRAGRLLLVFGLAGLAACDALLNVDNPATFSDADLDDPVLAPQLEAGVVARFNLMYDELALYSAVLTDEANTGHNFEQIQQVDLRQIDKTNTSANADVYNQLQRTRAAADSFGARLTRVLGDSATSSLRMARVQAYGALSYVLLGEFMCEAPVDPAQPAISSDSMFRIAISRANEAVNIANAFRTAGGAAARADSMINLARVSAARAYLNLGEKAQAAALAAQVPAAFELRVFYDDINMNNGFFGATQGSTGRWIGVDAAFRGLNDPRVRHGTSSVTGHDRVTPLFIPTLGTSFGGFNPTATIANQQYTRSTSIRVSSGLEAQYIRAEAEGLNATNLAFVNSRRAVGGQAALPSTITPAEFLTALIDQRRRDFFLDGHRLGDLRRYIRLYNLDFFPSGTRVSPRFPDSTYGTATCFVPSLNEEIGNPNF